MGPKKTSEDRKKSESRGVSQDDGDNQPKIDQQFVLERNRKEMEEVMRKLDSLASKEFINEAMGSLKSEVNKVHTALKEVTSRISVIESEVDEVKNEVSDYGARVLAVENMNKLTQDENRKLKELVEERETQLRVQRTELNNLEQYTRRNNLRIYGMDDRNPRESISQTAQIVVNLVRDKLDIDITADDIDMVHRLGRFTVEGNRPILCRFISRQDVLKIKQARRKCKGSGIVIREDLTAKNVKLLETVNALNGVKQAWTEQGKIMALLQDGTKKNINHETDLSKYM